MSLIPDFVFDIEPPATTFSEDELLLLKQILKLVSVYEHYDPKFGQVIRELRLKNVALLTDIVGASSVVVVDGTQAPGVQRPFDMRGPTKCLVCDEYSTEGVICDNCKMAIKWARTTNAPPPTRETLDLLKKVNDAGLLDALILMNKENIKKWMETETEEMK